eukprot:Opistho-1_new@39983
MADVDPALAGPVPPLKTIVFRSLKRTHDMFLGSYGKRVVLPEGHESKRIRLSCRLRDEYDAVRSLPPPPAQRPSAPAATSVPQPLMIEAPPVEVRGVHAYPSAPGVSLSEETAAAPRPVSHAASSQAQQQAQAWSQALVARTAPGIADIHAKTRTGSTALTVRSAPVTPKPRWHAPWKLMRVISGHTGWVRTVAVDPSNKWFTTGSVDRTIKIWDMASGTLKLSLTGHVSTVRGVVVSDRHPYLFSCGEDKSVKCWDLESNKVIRSYHGHLNGVYSIALHPTLDVILTGARDATCRVWDMRTKACVHILQGHTDTVGAVKAQGADPQVITGSNDSTVRLWDIRTGKTVTTLTNHKKGVRAIALHHTEFTFATAAPDNIKQWRFPNGDFIQNLSGHNALIDSMALNQDDVLVSGGDNGSMRFWDWRSGYNFQELQSPVQPGSLDSEAGVLAMAFDVTGSRLITGDADKSIKIYKEDDSATQETHPLNWQPSINRGKKF